MKPEKKQEYIERVLANAATGYTKISVYNCRYNCFRFKEHIRPTIETVPIIDLFCDQLILPAYSEGKKPSKISHKKRQFQIMAAHLALASIHRPLKFSRNKQAFTKYKILSHFIVFVVDWLLETGRIEQLKGKNFETKGSGWLTCICPTEKFQKELLSKVIVKADPELKPKGNLIIRKGKRVPAKDKNDKKKQQSWGWKKKKPPKKPIKYRDNKETKALKERLRKFNSVNSQYRVAISDDKRDIPITTDLYVVFNEELFKYNGRMHTSSFGYLNIPREDRLCLTIAGEKTVELDYSALHPRLLYVLRGKQYDDDPYEAVASGKVARKVMKKILLASINAKKLQSAVSAVSTQLDDDKDLKSAFTDAGYTVGSLAAEFIKVHAPIGKYFFSKEGLRLMRLDSQIAYGVVEHFTDQGKPCLPVHDSFVVRQRDEDELREVMQSQYGRVTKKYSPDNRIYTCKIDKK
ncbi:hypothetical protein [Desulfogranum marinum]|uniref:hypothetical protein n=1 Tax=Desulfogranum marinum TaxID=453220 RepID=UPI001963ADB6|nr:hypothetical protein [Desulfogranum marinum]MBM9514697.1 hypothetical protein [Desulfogranum marinum]